MVFLEIINKKKWNEFYFKRSISIYFIFNNYYENENDFNFYENDVFQLDKFFSYLNKHPEINVTNFYKLLKPNKDITIKEWKNILQEHLYQYNLLKSVMLAKDYLQVRKTKIESSEKIYVSPKLDGIRCVISYDKFTRQIVCSSRTGTIFDCCDKYIKKELLPLFEKDTTLILDGELYNDNKNFLKNPNYKFENYDWLKQQNKQEDTTEITFIQLISAVRTTKSKLTPEIEKIQDCLQYHVFDVMDSEKISVDKNYSIRLKFLNEEIFKNNTFTHIKLVPVISCTKKSVDFLFNDVIQYNYEGVMVRTDSLYDYGIRSNNLLKYKKFREDEFRIVGAIEGKKRLKGCLGSFICCSQKNYNYRFRVSIASSDEYKRYLWMNPEEYDGHFLTVQFQDISEKGIPRFPVGKTIRKYYEWI